ncbi:hypothetical protein JCM33374_g5376 [Metschnikowia sp. JCM 33374]|nr:hypothetical protein JCM33374_g5376 [Metschnikowia sp. JCM 33374]
MSSNNGELTVREKFNQIVWACNSIEQSSERQDSEHFQSLVSDTLKQLNTLQSIVRGLSLFSTNESLDEINTSYLPFATLSYYEAVLYQKLLTDANDTFQSGSIDRLLFKPINLKRAKVKILAFISQVDAFREILSDEQSRILNSFKKSYNPSNEDIIGASGDPTSKRASKISNYKKEKELREKLRVLEEFHSKHAHHYQEGTGEDILQTMDEDLVRSLYIDQLRLFSVYAFRDLELIAMELQVLQSDVGSRQPQSQHDSRQNSEPAIDKFEYTPRLESNPTKHKEISDLINKSGKILQPFVITNNKQKLQREVFGTGQVLPSMSIEEYLDYELSNGKMLKSEPNGSGSGDSDDQTEDSDEELRKREWDDWKDENPKGSGNMKANIG